jgi:hypothetical protein
MHVIATEIAVLFIYLHYLTTSAIKCKHHRTTKDNTRYSGQALMKFETFSAGFLQILNLQTSRKPDQ